MVTLKYVKRLHLYLSLWTLYIIVCLTKAMCWTLWRLRSSSLALSRLDTPRTLSQSLLPAHPYGCLLFPLRASVLSSFMSDIWWETCARHVIFIYKPSVIYVRPYQITLLTWWCAALSAPTLTTVTLFSPECKKQILQILQSCSASKIHWRAS